jgi:hypothetical protein
MKIRLLMWLALLLALLGPQNGAEVAVAKDVSVILSGGNLEQPVLIPWQGAIEPATSSQGRLLFPVDRSSEFMAAMQVYDVAYHLEMFSVGSPMRGTYVPRPSAEGSIYVPEGFGVDTLYLTTPEFDNVLKLYLTAALARPGVEIPSVEAARSLARGVGFDEAMARSGIGSREASLQSLFPGVDLAASDSGLTHEQVRRDRSAIDAATQDIVSPASGAPEDGFRPRLAPVAAGATIGIVGGGTLVGFALHWRKRRREVREG